MQQLRLVAETRTFGIPLEFFSAVQMLKVQLKQNKFLQ
jgi:hypothetical protein